MPLTADDPFFIPPFLRREAGATPDRRSCHKSTGAAFSNPGTEPQPMSRRQCREAHRTAMACHRLLDKARRKRAREARYRRRAKGAADAK